MTARIHEQKRPVVEALAELDTRDLTADFFAIAKRHGVTLWEVMGPRRFAQFAAARHECWAVLRERGWSLPRIGELFSRDHKTVMSGLKAHEQHLAKTLVRALRGAA